MNVFHTIIFFVLVIGSNCETITRDTANDYSTARCSNSTTDCTIDCTEEYSCGGEIHCPGTTSCSTCTILCNARHACHYATIYSHQCGTVDISTKDSDFGLAETIIYAPNNDGDLTISSDSGNKGFYASTVYDNKYTNSITLECKDTTYVDVGGGTHQPNATNECSSNIIYASNSNELFIDCQQYVDCVENEFYCPLNNLEYESGCDVTFNQATIDANIYYSPHGLIVMLLCCYVFYCCFLLLFCLCLILCYSFFI